MCDKKLFLSNEDFDYNGIQYIDPFILKYKPSKNLYLSINSFENIVLNMRTNLDFILEYKNIPIELLIHIIKNYFNNDNISFLRNKKNVINHIINDVYKTNNSSLCDLCILIEFEKDNLLNLIEKCENRYFNNIYIKLLKDVLFLNKNKTFVNLLKCSSIVNTTTIDNAIKYIFTNGSYKQVSLMVEFNNYLITDFANLFGNDYISDVKKEKIIKKIQEINSNINFKSFNGYKPTLLKDYKENIEKDIDFLVNNLKYILEYKNIDIEDYFYRLSNHEINSNFDNLYCRNSIYFYHFFHYSEEDNTLFLIETFSEYLGENEFDIMKLKLRMNVDIMKKLVNCIIKSKLKTEIYIFQWILKNFIYFKSDVQLFFIKIYIEKILYIDYDYHINDMYIILNRTTINIETVSTLIYILKINSLIKEGFLYMLLKKLVVLENQAIMELNDIRMNDTQNEMFTIEEIKQILLKYKI